MISLARYNRPRNVSLTKYWGGIASLISFKDLRANEKRTSQKLDLPRHWRELREFILIVRLCCSFNSHRNDRDKSGEVRRNQQMARLLNTDVDTRVPSCDTEIRIKGRKRQIKNSRVISMVFLHMDLPQVRHIVIVGRRYS